MNNSKIIQKLTITILLSAIFFKPEKVFATTPIGGFNDEETSENNSMETSTLDMEMRSPTEDFSPNVDLYLEDTAERTIEIENVRELGFLYSLEITGITGDTEFCEDLELEVYRDSTKLFNGTLGHFFLNLGGSDNYYFLENTDGTHEYLFSITIPDNDDPDLSDKSCDFDIEAVAWMENLGPYTGFWDEEVLSNSVSTSDWLMEMGYETAETQADDSDGNPILGLCNVVTEDKSQNSNQSALQILKWSQMEGADSYQITGYKLDSSNNWVKQGSAYNPADYIGS